MTDCPTLPPIPPTISDPLSAPTGDFLLAPLLSYLPRGSAWRTDYVADTTNASFLHKFWRAIADPVAWLYAKGWELALQSTACTVTSGLADWEAEFGLPDTCVAPVSSTVDRIAALRQKVAGEGGGSIEYFVCLAASLGYTVTITEPHFFECGVSSLESGGYTPIYFECGVSELGVDALSDFTGEPALLTDPFGPDFQSYWVVHVQGAVPIYFECGASSLGYDRLSDFVEALELECEFRARAPAHTTLIFDYSAVSTATS